MNILLRFLFLVGLFGYAAVFRLHETGLVGLIAADYAGFSVLYRVAQKRQARNFARDCRELIENYSVSHDLAKKLAGYWAKERR